MALLVLMRHTESAWNAEKRFTGWVDVPLTPRGRDEARRLGLVLAGRGYHFDLVYASCLARTAATLELMFEEGLPRVPVERDWRLNERFYGVWQGRLKDETARLEGEVTVAAARRGYATRPPGGESLQDTALRVLECFEARIAPAVRSGQRVLLVGHGNTLRALVMRLEGVPEAEMPGLLIGTGELREYEPDPRTGGWHHLGTLHADPAAE